MSQANQQDADLGSFQTTGDGSDNIPTEADIRQGVIAAVGDSSEIDEAGEDAVVGDDEVVMWESEDSDNTVGIPDDEYGAPSETTVETGYTEIGDGDDETVAVLVVSDGQNQSVLDAEKVAAVAEEIHDGDDMQQARRELFETAKLRAGEGYDNFPVRFEMESGELMVAPIIAENEIRDTR